MKSKKGEGTAPRGTEKVSNTKIGARPDTGAVKFKRGIENLIERRRKYYPIEDSAYNSAAGNLRDPIEARRARGGKSDKIPLKIREPT